MHLRTKLLLFLSVIIIAATMSASTGVYMTACAELEKEAKIRLKDSTALLAELVQRRFDAELRKFEHWAAMPMVIRTALDYKNPQLLSTFGSYFSAIVSMEPYTSIYLINREGDLVACDDPRRMHHQYVRNVVSKLADAHAGFAGTPSIGLPTLSLATGRPVVPLTAPVWHEGRVVAILRAGIDMGRLNQELLASLAFEQQERFYIFDPSIPLTLPKGHKLHAPSDLGPYKPLPDALQAAFERTTNDVFHYRTNSGEHLVASAQMQNPSWVFLVSQPMSEIIAPIRTLRQTTAVIVALMLVVLVGSIFLVTAPVVRGIESCRKFATNIRHGRLDHRMQIQSSDEVGQLSRDLNEMATQLQLNHQALEDAERKYRTIFENAGEGIFQTDIEGNILVANQALAAILGALSPAELVGRNVQQFYSDLQRRTELLTRLQAEGEVRSFAFEINRLDGTRRQVMLNARAEHNAEGEIGVIQGIIEDITERQEAKAQERRVHETEELLLQTEIEMLRYQINPHFLFNALNSLRELVISAPHDAVRMIESMAYFCRASLVNRAKVLSTVAEEIVHAKHYLEIQKARFGDRLQVRIDAGDGVRSVSIPAFIIQPLVENAVKYGRKSGANPLFVQIQASLDGDCCLIQVGNTGRWFDPDSEETGSSTRLGLENVQRRLTYHYGDGIGPTVTEEDGWVTITVHFPVLKPSGDGRGRGDEPDVNFASQRSA